MKINIKLEFHAKERKPGIMTNEDTKNLLALEDTIQKSIKKLFPDSSSYLYRSWPGDRQ